MKQKNTWIPFHIKQCAEFIGQNISTDEDVLERLSTDFGRLIHTKPAAVFLPETVIALEKLVQYAKMYDLPLTIHGHGMSQSGQSLAPSGGLVVNLEKLNAILSKNNQSIWVEASTTWADILHVSLAECAAPFVVPYNCHLSVGGVLSVGGLGASSFKYGSAIDHVEALEVLTADGISQQVDKNAALYHAVLGGQGRFGIITKACISLRSCAQRVRTFFLVYLDSQQWLDDIAKYQSCSDYMECFCSPAIQGAKLSPKGRTPFAQWLFALHVAFEYDEDPPVLTVLHPDSKHWNIAHVQDESIESYLFRHDARFNAMKITGQWAMTHVWYECFVGLKVLMQDLDELLTSLPLYYATVLQIVPIARSREAPGFLMLPEADAVAAVMILNPGLPESLVASCIETIQTLDHRFLNQGGKRYLSGFLGSDLRPEYWKKHFSNRYEDWMRLKARYDPDQLFQSVLY